MMCACCTLFSTITSGIMRHMFFLLIFYNVSCMELLGYGGEAMACQYYRATFTLADGAHHFKWSV